MANVSSDGGTARPIVVGVDGSESSKVALRWAADQAELTGAHLVVICTWEPQYEMDRSGARPKIADAQGIAQAILERTADEVLGTHRAADKITLTVIHGHPAPTLIDLSQTASLLVVGSRGHGEFTGMLLGSVSQHLATHAHCPVTIIRG